MRKALLLLSLLGSLICSAQSWCPPGAEWHWSIFALGVDGHVHRWYDGDTVIVGRTAQRIREEGTMIDHISQDTILLGQTYHTSVDNADVLLWVQYGEIWQWDTLYRFGATPGTVWEPATIYGQRFCSVQVTDTTTILVDGVPLRQLTLNYQAEEISMSWETIVTERLAGQNGMWDFGVQCMIDAGVEWIRCYSDVEIQYISPDWNFGCASPTGVSGSSANTLSLFPNPGTDHFTLQLPPGTHEITLFDAQGRLVLRQAVTEERAVISTSSLSSGIYHVQVTDLNGQGHGQRWVRIDPCSRHR